MGELIDITTARSHRDNRLAAAALHARMHPALRWHAGEDPSAAHRRTPSGRAVCGAPGRLRMATRRTPLCARCYPQQVAARGIDGDSGIGA